MKLLKVLCLLVVTAQCSVVLEAASAVTQGWTVGDTLGNLDLGSLNLQVQNIWNNFSLYLHPVKYLCEM